MIGTDYFSDPYLVEFFKEHSVQGICEISGYMGECVKIEDLQRLFDPIVKLYTTYDSHSAPAIFQGSGVYDLTPNIWEKIEDDFGIFSSANETGINQNIIETIYSLDRKGGGGPDFLDLPVYREEKYFWDEGELEEKLNSWDRFKEELKYENRFFPKETFSFTGLEELLELKSRLFDTKEPLFRIRKSKSKLDLDKMGAPPKEYAAVGRANPKGVPYLYLGDSVSLCQKEVRLALGEGYNVGEFKFNSKLKLVDLSTAYISSPFALGDRLSTYLDEIDLMKMFVSELSKPTDSHDPYFDYLPTQYLSEFIKHFGYDGYIFKSSLCDGLNFVIFNYEKTDCEKVQFYECFSCG